MKIKKMLLIVLVVFAFGCGRQPDTEDSIFSNEPPQPTVEPYKGGEPPKIPFNFPSILPEPSSFYEYSTDTNPFGTATVSRWPHEWRYGTYADLNMENLKDESWFLELYDILVPLAEDAGWKYFAYHRNGGHDYTIEFYIKNPGTGGETAPQPVVGDEELWIRIYDAERAMDPGKIWIVVSSTIAR